MLCHDIGLGFGRTSFYFQIFETLHGFQDTFPFSAFFHGSIDIHNFFQSYSQRMIKPDYFFILHVSYLFLSVVVGSLSAKSDRNSNQMNHENDSDFSKELKDRKWLGFKCSHFTLSPHVLSVLMCVPYISLSHCSQLYLPLWSTCLGTQLQHIPDFIASVINERLI